MVEKKENPLDYQFPDITSKPGQFLPSIFGGDQRGDFDVNKVEKDVIEKAADLQAKLAKQRQN